MTRAWRSAVVFVVFVLPGCVDGDQDTASEESILWTGLVWRHAPPDTMTQVLVASEGMPADVTVSFYLEDGTRACDVNRRVPAHGTVVVTTQGCTFAQALPQGKVTVMADGAVVPGGFIVLTDSRTSWVPLTWHQG